MRKRGILALGIFFLFTFMIFLVPISFAQVPDIGESSCQTYAQARAKGIQGTDAELRRMGFCPGEEATPSEERDSSSTAAEEEGEATEPKNQGTIGTVDYADFARQIQELEISLLETADILKDKIGQEGYKIAGKYADPIASAESETDAEYEKCTNACPYACTPSHCEIPPPEADMRIAQACVNKCGVALQARQIKRVESLVKKAKAEMYALSGDKTAAQETDSQSSGTDYTYIPSAKSLKLSQELEFYYNNLVSPNSITIKETSKKLAKSHFDDTLSLQTEVGRARFAYENAQKKGASKEELNKLKAEYEQKIPLLKTRLQNDVLNIDKSNTDAMWVLSTITKWENNNKESYEYTRDALTYEKTYNPIMYQRHMDTMRDPGVRMLLLQHFEPNEKIINLPTVETSPALRFLKDITDKATEKVDEKKRQVAREVEPFSRGYSLSNFLPKKLEEFSGISVEENE